MSDPVISAPEYDDARCKQFPSFGLTAMPDRDQDPQTVTILPKQERGADRQTNWLSVDAEHVLPVEECR